MYRITGTLVHYVRICPRKIWLMGHELNPDEDHPLLEWGRFLSEQAYPRQRVRQIHLPGMVLDWVDDQEGDLLVAEVKKSSRALPAARLQVLFYLSRLEDYGIAARGEIRVPKERKRVQVVLDEEGRRELEMAYAAIQRILEQPMPPPPEWISHCRGCAYAEFCWAETLEDDQ
jgi:CRISPR-associated exonuclease Cas4